MEDIKFFQSQPCKFNNNIKCKYCNIVICQDGWKFVGCFYKPYKGKAIFEIKECPINDNK